MGNYIYTFTNTRTKETTEVEGYNLFNAISKLGMVVSRVEKFGHHYLQSVPFEKRERIIWGGDYGNIMFIVKNRKKI